jgi:uncharacterized protein with von Willebrand factor type A (vWA) domain
MDQVLRDFLRALRAAGVKVSIPEGIDAMNTAKLVGYSDRAVLKDALSVVVAKSLPEKQVFDEGFDRFFSFALFGDKTKPLSTAASDIQTGQPSLAEMLLSGNSTGLAASLRDAAQKVDLPQMRFVMQRGLYTGMILRQMGIEALHREIDRLAQESEDSARRIAHQLEAAEEELLRSVGQYVEQQFALYGSHGQEELYEDYLKKTRLSELEQRDLHRMHIVIQKMVKRLNDVHSRRRKAFRRGQLDFRHTLRSNITYDGVLFDIKWKKRKIDRPNVVALCDVSSSVSAVARFLLLFLYSLNRRLARIRTFTFCSNLIEVTQIFDDYPVDEALVKLKSGVGLGILMGPTDYGQAFRDLEQNWPDLITNRTTVLILGDARNNFGDAEVQILKSMHQRSKRVIWLNPEAPSFWGTGDSEMKRYLPYCNVARECNTVAHLERVVDSLLHP